MQCLLPSFAISYLCPWLIFLCCTYHHFAFEKDSNNLLIFEFSDIFAIYVLNVEVKLIIISCRLHFK